MMVGCLVLATLLVRFSLDFVRQMKWWLSVPFIVLVLGTLVIGALNSFPVSKGNNANDRRVRSLLVISIPLGCLASSLGCSGLQLQGCSQYCTFVKLVWIPLLAIVCTLYLVFESRWLLLLGSIMAFVPLFPHCVCYNVGNGWWIRLIGASPECYAWGFAVSILAVGAVTRGAWLRVSAVLNIVIIAGATGFFISHHYFKYPW